MILWSKVVREGEELVAGHAEKTMTEFYDLNVKKTTVRVINAVAEKYQMNGEAEDVDALCIGSQREKEVSTFKETAQLEKMKKLSKKKRVRKEFNRCSW